MDHTIDVHCSQGHPGGAASQVARLRHIASGTADDRWTAYDQRLDREAVGGKRRQAWGDDELRDYMMETIDGKPVDPVDDVLHFEATGQPLARQGHAVTAKLDLLCQHPHCGFHLQRRMSQVAPLLTVLEDAGVTSVDLKALARMLETARRKSSSPGQ